MRLCLDSPIQLHKFTWIHLYTGISIQLGFFTSVHLSGCTYKHLYACASSQLCNYTVYTSIYPCIYTTIRRDVSLACVVACICLCLCLCTSMGMFVYICSHVARRQADVVCMLVLPVGLARTQMLSRRVGRARCGCIGSRHHLLTRTIVCGQGREQKLEQTLGCVNKMRGSDGAP